MERLMLPRLGQTMEEGTLLEWLIEVGDEFSVGDALYDLETDKATLVVEATIGGTLGLILVEAGATVSVGSVLGVVIAPGETPNSEEMLAFARSGDLVEPSPPLPSTPQQEVSPQAPTVDREFDLAGVQRAMARVMAQSWVEAPQFHQRFLADVSGLVARLDGLRTREEFNHAFRLSLTDLLLEAVVSATSAAPEVNATIREEHVVVSAAVNVAVAVDTVGGLVAPVIKRAESMSLGERGQSLRDLVERARTRSLRPEDLADGTITVSNLGMHGVEDGVALVTRPQVAAVFFGSIVDRPVAIDGRAEVRPTMYVTATFDHRVIDGAAGGRFTTALKSALERAAD